MPQPNGALNVQVSSTEAYIPDDPSAPIEYSEEVMEYPEITANKSDGKSSTRSGMMSA